MLPVLRAAADGEVRITDIVELLADEFALSPDERAHLLPSGRQTTFANRVHWAKSYLGKAGLVELTRRAHFRITDRGREVLAAPPERIDIKFLNRFPDFQRFREAEAEAATEAGTAQAPSASQGDTVLTPDEVMRGAHRQLEAAWPMTCSNAPEFPSGPPCFQNSIWHDHAGIRFSGLFCSPYVSITLLRYTTYGRYNSINGQ
ncbi:winged helix-turn-helix domain-containing protein [Azospirillum sp. sgz301742]